jgi:hypothetical protein
MEFRTLFFGGKVGVLSFVAAKKRWVTLAAETTLP